MARLPKLGADANVWGAILNDFLTQEHNADGTLKLRTNGELSALEKRYTLPSDGIPETDLATAVRTKINELISDERVSSISQSKVTNLTTDLANKTPVVETINTITSTGSVTLPDVSVATIHNVTLTADTTFTFPAATIGKSFTLIICQDSTGGHGVTWPTSTKWPNGYAVTPTTTASSTDVISFMCVTEDVWYGLPSGYDMR